MYEVYAHKQAPKNLTESPDTQLGFSGTSQTNQGITAKQTVGIGFAVARILPAGKQIIQTVSKATGNKQVERAVAGVNRAVAFGTTALTLGIPAAITVEAISMGVNVVQGYIENITQQTNQEYERQKQGVSLNKFVGTGERID